MVARPLDDLAFERAVAGTEADDLGDAAALHRLGQVGGINAGDAVGAEHGAETGGEEAVIQPMCGRGGGVDVLGAGVLRNLGLDLTRIGGGGWGHGGRPAVTPARRWERGWDTTRILRSA